MKPRLSILSCASGRLSLFARHLDSLARQESAAECEYVVGIWGEDAGHRAELRAKRRRFAAVRLVSVDTDRWWPLPCACNAALNMARADRLLIVGSDIVLDGRLLAWALDRTEADVAWCFRVVREDGAEIVGPRRRLALPFCVTVPAGPVKHMNGWDTAFCDGPCYEDNDFAARLLLTGISYRWCDDFGNVHLSHGQYGGRERRGREKANASIWRQRIGGHVGSLWPLQGDGRTPRGAQGDGLSEQAAVRRRLEEWGYPRKGALGVPRSSSDAEARDNVSEGKHT